MDNEHINDSRNRVFTNSLAIGKNIPNSMSTSNTSIYRVTGLNQIEDIINCGYVRPKTGKLIGGHTNETFWTKGGEKTFYYDKRPVLEVPEDKLNDVKVLYKQRHSNNMDSVSLENLYSILNEKGYVCLGHGTGRTGNNLDTVQSIFQNGLRTKDNSLYYTAIGLDTTNIEALRQRLNAWQHQDSQKIILMRLPVEFINMLGDSADLDGEKFGAFYNEKISPDGKITYYLDSKFIIGCYDVQKQSVILNSKFEKILSEDTLRTLREKYKKTVEKTQTRFKRQEEALNNLNTNYSQNTQNELQNLEWNLSDFDDDIDWGIEQDETTKKDNYIKNYIARKKLIMQANKIQKQMKKQEKIINVILQHLDEMEEPKGDEVIIKK